LRKLYAVDHWAPILGVPESDDDYGQIGMEGRDGADAFRRFTINTRMFRNRLEVLRGDSVEMAKHVKDLSLDFVFIDADHRYVAALADIRAWAPKVREGGLVCGHDYNHRDFPGVKKAVVECFGENHVEVGIDGVWYARKEDYLL
jgi:hypothetical protein